MRRVFVLALAVTMALVFSAGVAQAKIEKIGVVNIQKILNEFKEAESVNNNLQTEKDALQEKLDKAQDEIKSKKDKYEKKIAKMSEADKKKASEELNKDLTTLQDTFQKYSNQLRAKQEEAYNDIQGKIMKTISEVAAAEAIDVVAEKAVVYVGGVDITEKVLEKLNGGKASASPKKKESKSEKKEEEVKIE